MLGKSVCRRQRCSVAATDLKLERLAPVREEVEGKTRLGCGPIMRRSLVRRLVLLDDGLQLGKIR